MTLFYDLETTGLDPDAARIVELAAVDGREASAGAGVGSGPAQTTLWGGATDPVPEPSCHLLFHPGVPIPEDASRVHGITDDDVADAPRFRDRAPEVQRLFEGRTLCGYNLRAFDTPLLDAELRRAEQPGLDLDGVREIDLYRVWSELEPTEGRGYRGYRTLEAAVERYLGRELIDAHGAAADALVLPELLAAVRDVHGLDRDELVELSAPASEVDRAGKLRREDGEVVFAFGRHAGDPVARHPDYVDWMLGADFPRETKRILRRLVDGV